ncbi:DegV family protein [Anaerofustis sp.]|uniref:DegV family protein n=1 Tax=Anaerofustis sp. TaxID=1872517 RepID=UPI0025BC28FE|nr:DegV family protein [Anaerofustis sp.]
MVKIIVDSTCDLNEDLIKKFDVEVIPLSVRFGNEEFLDGVTIKNEEFYEKLMLCGDSLPTTSQPNPNKFKDVFKKYIDKGDEIVAILISSKLSGTLQSAHIAKEEVSKDHIHIVDSKIASFGTYLLINEAVKMRDEGKTASEIAIKLEHMIKNIRLLVCVNTLKYLMYGGRISKTTAVVGGMLNINPILQVVDGEIVQAGKVRGKKLSYKFILENIKDDIDFSYPVAFGHAHAHKAIENFKDFMFSHLDIQESETISIGPTVGTYSGPGAIGIAYIKKETI